MAKWLAKERKRRLAGAWGWSTRECGKQSSLTEFKDGQKTVIFGASDADGLLAQHVSGQWRQDIILGEYAGLFGCGCKAHKQYSHPFVSGIVIKSCMPNAILAGETACSWPFWAEGIRPSIF